MGSLDDLLSVLPIHCNTGTEQASNSIQLPEPTICEYMTIRQQPSPFVSPRTLAILFCPPKLATWFNTSVLGCY